MLYRKKKSFSRGHGCSGDWVIDEYGNCKKVFTNVFPDYEIQPIIPSGIRNSNVSIDLSFLANSLLDLSDIEAKEKIISNLTLFVNDYSDWIEELEKRKMTLDEKFQETAELHIDRCKDAKDRMLSGVELLQNNEQVLFSFRLANFAMLLQQLHGSLNLDC